MKKRIIVFNALIVFFSTLSLFLILTISTTNNVKQSSYNKINNYSTLVSNYFEGTNYEETIDYFKSINELRVSIFDHQLNLIYDTHVLEDGGDNRPELVNLGVIYTRYSSNLKSDMLYLAYHDDNHIIRVCIYESHLQSEIITIINIGLTFLIIIFTLSVVVSMLLIKKTMTPINNVVNKLGSLCESSNLSIDNQEELYHQIDLIEQKISSKINDLNVEKEKVESILQASSEGIIVVNNNENIQLINKKALEIFNISNAVEQNYYILLKSTELIEAIKLVLNNQEVVNENTTIDNNTYEINITKIDNTYYKGILITLVDITKIYNLNKTKKTFFQNASHELKSPLTAILGYQQLLQMDNLEKEDYKDCIQSSINEANRMNRLITNMLELSKLESEITKEIEVVNIEDIVDKVLNSQKIFINKKNIELKLVKEKCLQNINELHAYELIKNLVENAIKYSKENGIVEVSIYKDKFIVKDYGIGIDKKNYDKIFERFYRVNSNNQIPGTGLGLAIVKHIVNIYNYEIVVQSILSKYTIITIEFRKEV